MQIPPNFALARLTSITAEEFVIRNIPCLLISRHSKIIKKNPFKNYKNTPNPDILPIAKCKSAD
jgi:hypothetical protein